MNLSRRQQGLIVMMGLSVVGWLFDGIFFSRPKAAAAAQTAPAAAPARPVHGPDVATLLQILSGQAADVTVLKTPARDPFVPAAPLATLLRPPTIALSETPVADSAAPQAPPLARPARLLGVVLGTQPIAVLDGRPYPLKARVGDCLVAEIRRDRVILRPLNGEPDIVLFLLPPGVSPSSTEDR